MTFCGEDRFHLVILGNDRRPCRRHGISVHAEASSNRGDRLLLGLKSHSINLNLCLRGVQPRRLGLTTLVNVILLVVLSFSGHMVKILVGSWYVNHAEYELSTLDEPCLDLKDGARGQRNMGFGKVRAHCVRSDDKRFLKGPYNPVYCCDRQ